MFFFNLAGRLPSKLKGAFLDNRKIAVISFVLCVKVRYAISETYLKLSDLNLVPEGAPKGTSGYPVFMIFGAENVVYLCFVNWVFLGEYSVPLSSVTIFVVF